LGVTRRLFLCAAATRPLVVEAIAAEKMPHRLILSGIAPAPLFELRQYEFRQAPEIWMGHGLRPVWSRDGRFLFAFASLAEREQAWRSLGADASWTGARVSEISLYRLG
jgi:hypothetical protein